MPDPRSRLYPLPRWSTPVPVSFDTDWLALSQDAAFADHLAIFALNLEYLWATNRSLDTATQDLLAAIDERHPE